MIRINNSLRDDYHTQLNNKKVPKRSCNTTSAIMFLKGNDIPFAYPKDMQPEDYLTDLLDTTEAWERMRKRHPWTEGTHYRPQEVHDILSWGINELVGETVSGFTERMPVNEMIYRIAQGEVLIVSGRFGRLDHIVAIVGLASNQRDLLEARSPADVVIDDVIAFRVDDPYGDYRTGYKDRRGNDVVMPLEDFYSFIKPTGEQSHKWAHYMLQGKRQEATVSDAKDDIE